MCGEGGLEGISRTFSAGERQESLTPPHVPRWDQHRIILCNGYLISIGKGVGFSNAYLL